MESSTNLHHHLQKAPTHGVGVAGTTHSWLPNTTNLNAAGGENLNRNGVEESSNNRRSRAALTEDNGYDELGFHHHHDDQSCLLVTNNYPKFSDMLINTTSTAPPPYGTSSTTTTNHMNEKLLFKTLFSGLDLYSPNYHNFGATAGANYIYPSINISNMNHHHHSPISSPPLTHHHPSQHVAATFTTTTTHNLSFTPQNHHHHNMQLHLPTHQTSSSIITTNASIVELKNGTAETKRGLCSSMESKASQSQTAPKKSRSSESPNSCPPFKVRKEKLGDRIAALQQLVAPFGKTDTASVLMEAIGYIKFLQGQVETLSVPYMKSSSQNQTNRLMMHHIHGGSSSGIGDEGHGELEAKKDLRRRGLCLVPLSCMSYIAGPDATTDVVWPQHPNFGAGTT